MLIMKKKSQDGFTLIEISVVVLIMGLILGSLLGPLSKQTEISKFKETRKQLEDVNEAILGFASANGYIPCPASSASNGLEARDANLNCNSSNGFVPYQALGVQVARDSSGVMIDVFLNRINYTVSDMNDPSGNNNLARDYTVFGASTALDDVLMNVLSPSAASNQNITVCRTTGCNASAAGIIIASNIPYLLHSPGKYVDQSPLEMENTDGDPEFIDGAVTEGSFEEILVWTSSNTLFSKMISAGQLP